MKDLITLLMSGKRIAILGFGKEGRSTYRIIRSFLPEQPVYILDSKPEIADDPELIKDPLIIFRVGSTLMKGINSYDLIIKAPGVPASAFPVTINKSLITSQTNLFLQQYSKQVIGVTGTKGKSTTASLIHHILLQAGYHSLLLGNIGLPPFEGIHEITPATRLVMELSSHQLEYLSRSPHISLLLNIFQEHLDHYASYEEYQQAKLNIGRYQTQEDFFIYCADNILLTNLVHQNDNLPHQAIPYSLSIQEKKGVFREEKLVKMCLDNKAEVIYDASTGQNLPGEHNFSNIMAAAAACRLAGVSTDAIQKGIGSFKGLEHRIEYVGEYDGIFFYNDSIATIPQATIEAVKTLKTVDTLILGGFDRGIDYSILYPYLLSSDIGNLIFIGEAGNRMQKELLATGFNNCSMLRAADYEEVVMIAKKVTMKGHICLLSPAAASYDMFQNFEHRGNIFKKNVRS